MVIEIAIYKIKLYFFCGFGCLFVLDYIKWFIFVSIETIKHPKDGKKIILYFNITIMIKYLPCSRIMKLTSRHHNNMTHED